MSSTELPSVKARDEQNNPISEYDRVCLARANFKVFINEPEAIGHYDTPKINAFSRIENNNSAITALMEGVPDNESHLAREAFIAHVRSLENKTPINPPGNKTTLQSLLGKDGLDLLQKAIEEEANTKGFREQVFNASANGFQGEKWQKRPITIVAGPSASGKSTITKLAIEQNQRLFSQPLTTSSSPNAPDIPTPASNDTDYNNITVSSDGGVVREQCQMRNLVVDLARSLGYSEISDLQSKTKKYLEPIKGYVENAVLETHDLGLVVPLTFSDLPKNHQEISHYLEYENSPNNCLVFLDVVPEDREAVRQQGESRSKQSSWDEIDNFKFSLNPQKGRPEFKTYQGGVFYAAGLLGSARARAYFEKNSKNGFVIKGINDLRRGPKYPISKRVLDRWQRFRNAGDEDLTSLSITLGINIEELKSAQQGSPEALSQYLELCSTIKKNELTEKQQEIIGPKFLDFELETSGQIELALEYRNFIKSDFRSFDDNVKLSLTALKDKLSFVETHGYGILTSTIHNKFSGGKLKGELADLKEKLSKAKSDLEKMPIWKNKEYTNPFMKIGVWLRCRKIKKTFKKLEKSINKTELDLITRLENEKNSRKKAYRHKQVKNSLNHLKKLNKKNKQNFGLMKKNPFSDLINKIKLYANEKISATELQGFIRKFEENNKANMGPLTQLLTDIDINKRMTEAAKRTQDLLDARLPKENLTASDKDMIDLIEDAISFYIETGDRKYLIDEIDAFMEHQWQIEPNKLNFVKSALIDFKYDAGIFIELSEKVIMSCQNQDGNILPEHKPLVDAIDNFQKVYTQFKIDKADHLELEKAIEKVCNINYSTDKSAACIIPQDKNISEPKNFKELKQELRHLQSHIKHQKNGQEFSNAKRNFRERLSQQPNNSSCANNPSQQTENHSPKSPNIKV